MAIRAPDGANNILQVHYLVDGAFPRRSNFPSPDQISVLLDKYRKHPFPAPIVSVVREGGKWGDR